MWRRAALVWLAAAAVSGMDDEMAELAKMVRDNCIGETGVDTALLDKVDAGADLMPDETFKCYIKCTMEMGGMMSDGEVDVDAVLELLPADVAVRSEAALRNCGTRTGADDCDTAFLTQSCWQQSNRADYFLI